MQDSVHLSLSSSGFSALPLPNRLTAIGHFHQTYGHHPTPSLVAEGCEIVELLTGGRGWVWHEEKWVEVIPGTLLWHFPGDETIGRSDLDNPYRCLALRMECQGLSERRIPRISFWNDFEAVRQLTREAVQCFVDDSFDKSMLLQYIFSRLLFQATCYHHRQEAPSLPVPLKKVLTYIAENIDQPITSHGLAHVAGWSVPHLHDQFKKVMGTSPHQQVLKLRLNKARELLVSTDHSIKHIGLATGFNASASFCQSFRKWFSVSPGKYRRHYFYGER
ncbi:MAG: helix-turn-helix transcriptional regulator [Opitutaceae bacterium]|nr:helix-turn-helix transcriptional regulator [Opitutaceae bacterium]